MKFRKLSSFLTFTAVLGTLATAPAELRGQQYMQPAAPKLVVNIVVSQMRYDYLSRFGRNMREDGIRKFADQGLVFTDARYGFMQTTTPAALATITTGADPAMHGIVSPRWVDYTTNAVITLLDDTSVSGVDCDAGRCRYSPRNLTVPTLGDRLLEENPDNRVFTIAADPLSAVVMGGQKSQVFWIDFSRGNWVSSTAYMSGLPGWAEKYNALRVADQYLDYKWRPVKHRNQYFNTTYSVVDIEESGGKKLDWLRRKEISRDYPGILRTPAGNSLVTEFVKQAVIYEKLGRGKGVDMLNICYDSPRFIGEAYGGESIEVEDMFYRLDAEIADLLTFIYAHMQGGGDVVVVLTSDHGASDSFDNGFGKGNGSGKGGGNGAGNDTGNGATPRDRFNGVQFKAIVNGFMHAQWGPGEWVIDYCDRQLFFNRNLVYTRGLSLEEVQNRVAAFALQFRGVSHVLTSTAMQMSSFNGGYAQMMQNSFYPKRSGDVTINLMPGWIEEIEGVRSLSGSMYEYDTHVPLMILAPRLGPRKIARTVDMRDVAPTLARIMRIGRPIAAQGEPLEEVAHIFE